MHQKEQASRTVVGKGGVKFCMAILACVILSACAQTSRQSRGGADSAMGVVDPSGVSSSGQSNMANIVRNLEFYREGESVSEQPVESEFENLPPEAIPMVNKWVAYFQGRGRPHMERYLARSTRYSSVMKKILRENGLPEDLIYIALIESGFSSRATSRAAAVGYWQFIRGTGRRYSLEINPLIDERRDPLLSTQAAAEYFKGLYSVFGSWYLSMASYNVGENRVKKEVMRHMTRSFWELARKKRLPSETINYVPKFLAARMIGRDPARFGFTDIDYEKPFEFELLKVAKAVNLKKMSEILGIEYDDFKLMNPKFRGEVAPLRDGQLELRIPLGQRALAMNAAEQSYVDKVEFIADAGETETYRVKSGDSLYIIAKRFRTTVGWLRDVNDLKPGKKLRIGMRMQVPDRSSPSRQSSYIAKSKPSAGRTLAGKGESSAATAAPSPAGVVANLKGEDQESAKPVEIVLPSGVYYLVQAGDSLSSIAEDYDSSVRELRKMNKLKSGQVIKVGMRLKVPKDEGLPKEVDPGATPAGPQHVVKRGENLHLIAKKYGVTVQELLKANNLQRRSFLRVGARLRIPADEKISGPTGATPSSARQSYKKVHLVKKGETLKKIADKYDTSIGRLRRLNNLDSTAVAAGTKLFIR